MSDIQAIEPKQVNTQRKEVLILEGDSYTTGNKHLTLIDTSFDLNWQHQ